MNKVATRLTWLLAIHAFFTTSVQCAKANKPEQPKESNFQSVGLEMILFPGPVHSDGNCQQVCDKRFKILEAFINKRQRGKSMLRKPIVISGGKFKAKVRSKVGEAASDAAVEVFNIDPCLFYHRYCTSNADVWLVPFNPDHFVSVADADANAALQEARNIARKTFRDSLPVTSHTLSSMDFWLGQSCMCQRFIIFSAVYKPAYGPGPGPFHNPYRKGKVAKEYPEGGCHPNEICTRLTALLFILNQRSNQWFCNMGFVVDGTEGQGIEGARDQAGHCVCELITGTREIGVTTVCFSTEDIMRGIAAAQIRPDSQLQLEIQTQSLRTVLVVSEEDNPLTRLDLIHDEITDLDDLLISENLQPLDDFPAELEPSFQQPHPNVDVSGISQQMRVHTHTLDELAQAGNTVTHMALGELDFLASQIVRQSQRQGYHQVSNQPHLTRPMLAAAVNPGLAIGSNNIPNAPFSFGFNIDNIPSQLLPAQQLYQESSWANEASTSDSSAAHWQAGKGKRKASDLEPMDRIRASQSQSALLELTTADDVWLHHDGYEGSLDSMYLPHRGITIESLDPDPVENVIAYALPETSAAGEIDDVDTFTEAEANEDHFSGFL